MASSLQKNILTVVGPLPELEIHALNLGSNASAAQRESGIAQLLQHAIGHQIVKLPRVAGYECLYSQGGIVRLMRLYDPLHDEIVERLDVAFIRVTPAEETQTIQ